MDIVIDSSLKSMWPETALGVLEYEAEVVKSPDELLDAFEETIEKLSDEYCMDDIAKLQHIAATRKAYKTLGKNPSEYRNAAEAMLRRVVKNNGLYHINNIVEVNNLISISSGYSIGSYDEGEVKGQVVYKKAEEDLHYAGIGKNSVNIGCIPTLHDEEGAFGNATSDSQRAMIKEGRRKIASVIYSFDGTDGLMEWMDEFEADLKKYCGVDSVSKRIIE